TGEIYLQLAEAYDYNNKPQEAIRILNNSTHFNKKEKVKADLLLGEIYKKQKNYDASLEQYQKALQNNSGPSNSNELAIINSKIAEVYKDQKISKKSLEYLNKAKHEALESKNTDLLRDINSLISQEFKENKNYKEEIKIREQNLSISIANKDTTLYVNEAVALAYLYLRSNQFKKAEDLVNRVIYFAQTNQKHIKLEALAYKAKAMLYQLNGNYPLSNTYYTYYAKTVDTLLKRLEDKEAQNLKASALFAEKQKQIDLLEKDATINKKTIEALSNAQVAVDERIARQKIIIWSLAFGIVLIVISAYIIYQNAQKRRLANQLLALKSLRSQMNPHFIFNALNSVNSFISINDEKSANKYLADFSKLMRMVMENSQHEFITLSQEVEILTLYLSLEHFRFKNKFNYTFTIDEGIDKDFISIPPMIIQPHIENAIWHGLRYKEEMGFLKVHIFKKDDNNIQISISDDGIGRHRSQQLKTMNQKSNKSTGIKNTQNRIELIKEIYGKDITIKITDAYIEAHDPGTRVEIVIPTQINQENYA
ncbi:MAG TPA: histidine kinase, partial [Cytophagales bacterium]|nr:histidine kinase [Cytophagales bacterium]